jgi:hypothetical protein
MTVLRGFIRQVLLFENDAESLNDPDVDLKYVVAGQWSGDTLRREHDEVLLHEKRKRKLKKPRGKFATISADYESDLSLIMTWLRLNKAIKSAGEIRQVGNRYSVRVKVSPKSSRQDVKNLVKDRFGVFGEVY